ncbi:MAG: dihydrodipicolinate synthase family protein [Thermomicrobiales bacterium]|nr:dihydrodipicolinate synthase family protein [Thermomicrobiales bacterium]
MGVRGIVPAIVTPFNVDGSVDHESLRRVVADQRAAGADGLLTLGLAGEGIFLDFDERAAVLQTVLSAANDLPVLAGCTADTTDEVCKLAAMAVSAGAAEVMVAPPRRPDWSVQQFRDHFAEIAAVTTADVMIQDAPFATGVELGVEFVLDLAAAHSNVRSYKVEALPYWTNAVRARSAVGDKLRVLGGHAGLYMMDVLDSEADGLIPGCDVTGSLVSIWDAYKSGDRERAQQKHLQMLPFLVYQAQSLGVIIGGAKAVLHDRGVIATTAARLPEARLDEATRDRQLAIARQCGLLQRGV